MKKIKLPEEYTYIAVFLTLRCNFTCHYCLSGNTKILTPTGLREIKDIKVGDEVIGFEEYSTKQKSRKLSITKVTETFKSINRTIRINTENTHLNITKNHPVLTLYRDWKDAGDLTINNIIMSPIDISIFYNNIEIDNDFKLSYIKGIIEGDGSFKIANKFQKDKTSDKFYEQHSLSLRMWDEEPLITTNNYINDIFGYKLNICKNGISIGIKNKVLEIYNKIEYKQKFSKISREFAAGYLGGIFDAEGSINSVIRISNSDINILYNIKLALDILDFKWVEESRKRDEVKSIRILGRLEEKVRFFHLCKPVIKRKIKSLYNNSIRRSEKITSIEKEKTFTEEVYNLETETGTYIANGLCVHNCVNSLSEKLIRSRKELTGKQWIKGLNRLSIPDSIAVTIGGGEPTIHKDFYSIMTNVKYPIDLLTNLTFDVEEFTQKVNPRWMFKSDIEGYKSVRSSFHPDFMNIEETVEKCVKLQNAGFNVGINPTNFPHSTEFNLRLAEVARKNMVYTFIKDYLGEYKGKMIGHFKYPDGVSGNTKSVMCRTKELLISPDGNIYKCHRDLYANEYPIGNILNENLKIEHKFRDCKNFGKCNPCDVKEKTNRFLEMGVCSVDIKNVIGESWDE